jgi:hypothetical protein
MIISESVHKGVLTEMYTLVNMYRHLDLTKQRGIYEKWESGKTI